MKCPRCGGDGICIECRGTGSITCSECQGSGAIFLELTSGKTKSSPCSYCHGKGTVECSKVCESCGGSGEITSQFQKEIREKYQPSFTLVKDYRAYVSLTILIINLVLFVADSALDMLFGRKLLLDFGALYTPFVMAGAWWRIITPIFLHLDIWHFLMNSYCLFLLCPPIEKNIGPWRFMGLYLFSGIAGNVVSLYLLPDVGSAGASGALFGIMGAYFGLNFRYRLFDPSLMNQLLYWLMLNIGIGFIPGLNINIWAHLGGLAGGFIFSSFMKVKA